MGNLLIGPDGRKLFRELKHQKALSSLAISRNHFTRDMYVKLAKESSGNLFFSPFSIISALGMTLGGARGNTKAEMHKVLHLEDDDSIHDAFSVIIADIKTEVPEYELQIANMVYVSDQLKVLDEYMELLTQKYMSSAETVDFNQEAEVRAKINGAVENATKSRIKDLILPGTLDSLTRMVLVNAVYFKGLWEHQFMKGRTYDEDFWTSASSIVKVPMMHIQKKFGSSVNEELQASLLRMNYQMGMVDLFSEKDADLSGISGDKDLFVSKVLHKAFLDVNEEGTEAAAAIGMGFAQFSMPLVGRFVADHPFLFFIQDRHSGFVHFAGRLANV